HFLLPEVFRSTRRSGLAPTEGPARASHYASRWRVVRSCKLLAGQRAAAARAWAVEAAPVVLQKLARTSWSVAWISVPAWVRKQRRYAARIAEAAPVRRTSKPARRSPVPAPGRARVFRWGVTLILAGCRFAEHAQLDHCNP